MPEFKHFERPTTEKPGTFISSVLASAAIGLVTGAAGFTLMQRAYPDSTSYILGENQLIPRETTAPSFSDVESLLQDHTAVIYRESSTLIPNAGKVYYDGLYVGTATIISSDGWLMLPGNIAANTVTADTIAFIGDRSNAVIDRKYDSRFDVTFFKIDATNLKPIELASPDETRSGVDFFSVVARIGNDPLVGRVSLVQRSVIDTSSIQSQVQASDSSVRFGRLAESGTEREPLYTEGGRLAGFAYDTSYVSAGVVEAVIRHFLQGSEYPSLGITYIDRSRLQANAAGVVVYASSGRPSVVANSAAAKAGLRAGDIITKFNGSILDENTDLAEQLLKHQPGDEVSIEYERGGETTQIVVTLQ